MDPGSPTFPPYYFHGSHGAESPPSSARSTSSESSAGEGSAAAHEEEKSAAALPSWMQQGARATKHEAYHLNVGLERGTVLGPLVDANGVLNEHGDPVVCWWHFLGCEPLELRATLECEPRSCIVDDDDLLEDLELVWNPSPLVWNDQLGEDEREDEPLAWPLVEVVVRTEKKTEYLVGALFHHDEEEMFQPAQRCFLGFVEAGLAPPTWASRKGLRTLACGDFVENERGAVAVVVRVLTFEWPLDSPNKQWRNVLVLYDEQAETFFIGGWSKWTRTTWPYGTWPYGDEVETLADFNDENVYVDGTAKIVKIDQLLALDKIRNLPTSTVVSRSKKDALTPTEEKDAAEERRRAQREETRGRREAEARR